MSSPATLGDPSRLPCGFSRTAILVTVLVIAAMLAVLNLLVGEPLREAAERGARRAPPTDATEETLVASAGLESAPGADPGAREARERARREADSAPRFPRSEGVFGFVVEGRGKPVPGATVKLFALSSDDVSRWQPGPDPEPAATTTSGEDGAFLIGPAPDGATLRLRAEAAGYAPTTLQVPRRGTQVELVLDLGGELKVRVLDGEGAPVADAAVLHTAGTVATSAKTDAEGRAVLGAVPTGQGMLLVAKDGHGAARRPDVAVAPGQTLEVTVLLGKPITMAGRVVAAKGDRPVPDAVVTLAYSFFTAAPAPAPTRSGPDGTFRLELAAPVGEQFVLTAESEGRIGRTYLNVNDTGGGAMDALVKVDDAMLTLAGRVVDARGQPAERVLVTLGWSQPAAKSPEATTGEDGRFELPLPPGSAPGSFWNVLAMSDTHGMGAAQGRIPTKPDERVEPLLVTLSGSGAVQGHVLGKDGPVEGALVALTIDWALARQNRVRGNASWMVMNVLQDPRRASSLTAVTAADGSFLVPSVPAATFRATATHGSTQATASDPVVVTAGSTTDVEIALGSGLTIEGTVVDEAGAPVAGAWVYGSAQVGREGGWGSRSVGARSQSDGSFVIRGVTDGSWTLQAWAGGYASQAAPNVPAGTTGQTIRLQAMGWVEGVVLEGSRPYRGPFTVSAASVQQNPQEGVMSFGGPNEQAFNTDDGRFHYRGLGAGSWLLTARTPDGRITRQALRVDVANGRGTTDVSLVLAVGASVSGTVVGEESGEPVAGANVQFVGRGGDGAPRTTAAVTDTKGRFQVRGLAPGAYTVHVAPPSGVQWQEDLEVREAETKEVRYVERLPGSLRILVVDAEQTPLAGAQPVVTTAAGGHVWPSWQALQRDGSMDVASRGPDPWQKILRTDATGVNVRQHVPPGRYQVTAQLQGYAGSNEAPWVEVHSRRTTDVTVVMKRAEGETAENR